MTIDEAREICRDNDFTLFADGLDEAFIDLGKRNYQVIAVYSAPRAVLLFERDAREACGVCKMGGPCEDDHYAEGLEYFIFNVLGAWVGEGTPLWVGI